MMDSFAFHLKNGSLYPQNAEETKLPRFKVIYPDIFFSPKEWFVKDLLTYSTGRPRNAETFNTSFVEYLGGRTIRWKIKIRLDVQMRYARLDD
ncbi:hypothetical protein NPIL_43161 [Nephila pilipes]|uniref:Uncharacterized protein n=1 Tax=Nephila pilipes TaxID=299642 RepID=A0A8X6UNH1_NEPPI|nr:hypothetical protein NPIL_43161 [Nephila pilipes]